MKNKAIAIEWLKRAKSNLEIAIIGELSNTILYEDLCFECQQAVEKALKGFLIFIEIPFSKTHSISYLIDMLESNGINIPDMVKEAVILTDYAVTTRYPGDYKSVDEDKYKNAIRIAVNVVKWMEERINIQ